MSTNPLPAKVPPLVHEILGDALSHWASRLQGHCPPDRHAHLAMVAVAKVASIETGMPWHISTHPSLAALGKGLHLVSSDGCDGVRCVTLARDDGPWYANQGAPGPGWRPVWKVTAHRGGKLLASPTRTGRLNWLPQAIWHAVRTTLTSK